MILNLESEYATDVKIAEWFGGQCEACRSRRGGNAIVNACVTIGADIDIQGIQLPLPMPKRIFDLGASHERRMVPAPLISTLSCI